jgi:hypothetical protein
LVERFDGVTAYLHFPAQGAWTAPDGRVERDDVVMVEVVTETFDREWWRAYAARLAGRRHGPGQLTPIRRQQRADLITFLEGSIRSPT